MTPLRKFDLPVAQTSLKLPCFFPSVSSVKTNLKPVDYIECLDAAAHPLFLASAFDLANCTEDDRARIDAALDRSSNRGSVVLLDSGNYERFWRDRPDWTPDRFHEVCSRSQQDLCFCFDNQDPPSDPAAIAEDVVSSVLRDQPHALGTIAPIVHGPAELLPSAVAMVAQQLYPVTLAVPERSLGDGILARVRTIRRIRQLLDTQDIYCPLHLLGTGNPLSIALYAIAGADSFDGLEWCQTVVDHRTGHLSHFQHWDLFRGQTEWGRDANLPFIQSVLLHNMTFYRDFMAELRGALMQNTAPAFLERLVPEGQVVPLLAAATDGQAS